MKIRIPATSANLGPGFDSLGLALKLYNTYEFKESEETRLIEKYQSADIENNLIYKSYKEGFKAFGEKVRPVEIRVDAQIPRSRGLGSSSACIVAGITMAYMMMERELDRMEIFRLANKLEGHPDNVCPCIFGGLNTSLASQDRIYREEIEIKNPYKFTAIIPDYKLNTREARKVLPEKIKIEDATYNLGRLALLIASLSKGKDENLKEAFKDSLHQPYRGKLIASYDELMDFLSSLSLASYLSGAGPTIMAVTDNNRSIKKEIEDFTNNLEGTYQVLELSMDDVGIKILDN